LRVNQFQVGLAQRLARNQFETCASLAGQAAEIFQGLVEVALAEPVTRRGCQRKPDKANGLTGVANVADAAGQQFDEQFAGGEILLWEDDPAGDVTPRQQSKRQIVAQTLEADGTETLADETGRLADQPGKRFGVAPFDGVEGKTRSFFDNDSARVNRCRGDAEDVGVGLLAALGVFLLDCLAALDVGAGWFSRFKRLRQTYRPNRHQKCVALGHAGLLACWLAGLLACSRVPVN
jgi:hypothetical protein